MSQNCKKKKKNLQGVAMWEGGRGHMPPKINGGLTFGGGHKESWHFMSADQLFIWRGRIKSLHLSPKLTQRKKVLRYNFRLALQIVFFFGSQIFMGVPGGHPVQGRRNRERPHFWGQPKLCPFLTFNTLHNVRWKVPPLVLCPPRWKSATVIELSAPLVLCPPPLKNAPVIKIECPFCLVPPPPYWKSAPSDRNWVPILV